MENDHEEYNILILMKNRKIEIRLWTEYNRNRFFYILNSENVQTF